MGELPPESEQLLAVPPSDFVAERQRLARELREAGRAEDATAVARLQKPSAVVFAVNRAARDRPKAARAAADAAERVEKAQAGGDAQLFRAALGELTESLDLLSEVAVAHVGPRGKQPTDAMRRRVHDLLRRAVATAETRAALVRGALAEEQDAAGFSTFARMAAKTRRRTSKAAAAGTRARRQGEQRWKRVQALRAELARAEEALEDAVRAERKAERERTKAEQAVALLQAKLDRLV